MDAAQQLALNLAERMAAAHKLVELSLNTEVQLRHSDDWTPVMAILSRAEDEAAAALVALTTASVDRPDVIREFQNKVWRFDSLVRWLREIMVEGEDAKRTITENRSEYLRELVIDDQTRELLGLTEPQATE